MSKSALAAIHRSNYRPPDWLVPQIHLDFQLDGACTCVTARLEVARNGDHDRPLRLDGDELRLTALKVDGAERKDFSLSGNGLEIALVGARHVIETRVEIHPDANSKLMGLYASGGLLCTQCEAEGFRRITFFPDRPDVLSVYTVRMTANAALYPILLANGDPVASGANDDGTHWAEWHDPWPKPCYLFALVAGKLVANRDEFTTASGRKVVLGIWVREGDVPRTHHAMHALKTSMAWDEQVFGREYDLDRFNIVAVDDFNFGAMENKGLNIFNARYILADPETATDLDYDNVLGVVAHEYFHNWSGNRVTCRDWFQLSLKEGFTVFRDQWFSADQGSAAVKRIEDVRMLRAAQFPEDSGPLAHPIRPESYIEISNFYTATIYNKGAEVIRMILTLLGRERFRAGSDLYFARHDGEAATCDEFVSAMEDGGGADLGRFRRWYSAAGTPHVRLSGEHQSDCFSLTLTQSRNGEPVDDEHALTLPLRLALFDRATGSHRGETLVVFDTPARTLTFEGWAQPPVVSINRGFSAPVVIEGEHSAEDLAFLSAHDDDPFARYEAMQQLMLDTLTAAVRDDSPDTMRQQALIAAIGHTLADERLDPALIAEAVLLPAEAVIGDRMTRVDPDAIGAARDALRVTIGLAHGPAFRALHQRHAPTSYAYTPEAKGARRLRAVALGYLAVADRAAGAALADAESRSADNMTDWLSALSALASGDAPERVPALERFYERWQDNALVLDKWFTLQALSTRADTVENVTALTHHPDFTLSNPNRFRALIGAFTVNPRAFHRADGAGYALVTDQILALDRVNPQTAARMVPPFGRWKRYDPARQSLMRAALARIVETPGLSKDVFEQASKSLKG